MPYTEQEHKAEHDSEVSPVVGCEWCAEEVYRRTHKCHGRGKGSETIPEK